MSSEKIGVQAKTLCRVEPGLGSSLLTAKFLCHQTRSSATAKVGIIFVHIVQKNRLQEAASRREGRFLRRTGLHVLLVARTLSILHLPHDPSPVKFLCVGNISVAGRCKTFGIIADGTRVRWVTVCRQLV
uniref:Neuroendocrine protein 7B2 n=1 Tax=Schistocephalus solidus TaxID=70667 RepID=A0A0V0J4E0_SCHSO